MRIKSGAFRENSSFLTFMDGGDYAMTNEDKQQWNAMNKSMQDINERMESLAVRMENSQIADYVELLKRPRKIIFSNLIGGIARGVGFVIGFTIFTSILLYILQYLGALNLPVIGDFIADIVKIVQAQLSDGGYY